LDQPFKNVDVTETSPDRNVEMSFRQDLFDESTWISISRSDCQKTYAGPHPMDSQISTTGVALGCPNGAFVVPTTTRYRKGFQPAGFNRSTLAYLCPLGEYPLQIVSHFANKQPASTRRASMAPVTFLMSYSSLRAAFDSPSVILCDHVPVLLVISETEFP
jgi:hypothetical protein